MTGREAAPQHGPAAGGCAMAHRLPGSGSGCRQRGGAAELALGGSTVLMGVALRRRVGVRAAEDVRVAERVRRPAVLLRCGSRRALTVLQRLPPGVDRRAVLGVAGVVP